MLDLWEYLPFLPVKIIHSCYQDYGSNKKHTNINDMSSIQNRGDLNLIYNIERTPQRVWVENFQGLVQVLLKSSQQEILEPLNLFFSFELKIQPYNEELRPKTTWLSIKKISLIAFLG